MNKPGRHLAPKEVLRVMDAAQVIHERQAALREHEELDREATIRDIQIMYEELGDLVDTRVIEKALDEYMAQRYAFTPPPAGLGKQLALLYIRCGWVTKRVLLPAAGVAALVWGGFAGADLMERRALERDAERVRVEVARVEALEPEISGLHAAVLTEAIEELARERAAVLRRSADAQLAARDLDGLEETARSYRQLQRQVGSEYEIVIVGGVWRFHTELDGVRNYYLRVQAIAADGSKVPVVIRNEEDGTTAEVTEWAERVPQELYDRVGADKQDNGIIDDDDFGFKRRGFVTAERNYEDLGQITEW